MGTRLEQNSGKLSQTSTELTQQGLIMVNLKGLSTIFKLKGLSTIFQLKGSSTIFKLKGLSTILS